MLKGIMRRTPSMRCLKGWIPSWKKAWQTWLSVWIVLRRVFVAVVVAVVAGLMVKAVEGVTVAVVAMVMVGEGVIVVDGMVVHAFIHMEVSALSLMVIATIVVCMGIGRRNAFGHVGFVMIEPIMSLGALRIPVHLLIGL
jgi:hypothetical protein